MKGYWSKLLRIDLTTEKITNENIPQSYFEDYIGGSGLGIRLIYDEMDPSIDPFSPEALLLFVTGPVTASPLGTAGRFQVVFKSPQTGILCDSSSGGFWGTELKNAGYDVLLIKGKANHPVYISIFDDVVQIRSAEHLMGLTTFETRDHLIEENRNLKARVLCIGPAGENLTLYSNLMNDEARMVGRGGPGGVMGSKNLKAIVVRGTRKVELFGEEEFKKFAIHLNKLSATAPGIDNLRKYGTAEVMDNAWPTSDIPVKNWSVGSYEELTLPLGGKLMKATMLKHHVGCYHCTIGCSRWVQIREGKYQMDAPGPEYETLGAMGTLCMINDLEAVSYAAHLCNAYGLDTISYGSSIAFAMECYEKRLLTDQETEGIRMTWGNKDVLVDLVKQVAYKEGFGKFVGLGVKRMSEIIKKDSDKFAVHVKGMEVPMHDPRAYFSWASNYATSPRGACHLHGMSAIYENSNDPIPDWDLKGYYPRHSNETKGKITRLAQNWSHIIDSMVVCYFASFQMTPSDLVNLINLATGMNLSVMKLCEIGDRINALHRVFNYRCGTRAIDDNLPERLLTPLESGGAANQVPDLDYQLKEYYEIRGWEKDGKPSKSSLQKLGLDDVINDLYSR